MSRLAKSGLRSAGAIPIAVNEPILSFAPGSSERAELRSALKKIEAETREIPIVIGGQEVRTDNVRYQVSPYNHQQKIAKYYWADKDLVTKAADAAVAAQVRHIFPRSYLIIIIKARMGAQTVARPGSNFLEGGRYDQRPPTRRSLGFYHGWSSKQSKSKDSIIHQFFH